MKKTYFQNAMDKLTSEKEANIKKLVDLSYDKLYELKIYYYKLHLSCKSTAYYMEERDPSQWFGLETPDGYFEAAEVNYFKFEIYDKAIREKEKIDESKLLY